MSFDASSVLTAIINSLSTLTTFSLWSSHHKWYSSRRNGSGDIWLCFKGGCIFDNFVEPRIQSLNLRVQCLASLGTKIKKIFAFKGGTTFQLERSKTLTTGKILDYLHGLLKCVTPVFHQTSWVAPAWLVCLAEQ